MLGYLLFLRLVGYIRPRPEKYTMKSGNIALAGRDLILFSKHILGRTLYTFGAPSITSYRLIQISFGRLGLS